MTPSSLHALSPRRQWTQHLRGPLDNGRKLDTGVAGHWTLDKDGKAILPNLTWSYLRWLSILQIVSYSRSIAWKEHQVSFVKKINRDRVKYVLVSCIVLAALNIFKILSEYSYHLLSNYHDLPVNPDLRQLWAAKDKSARSPQTGSRQSGNPPRRHNPNMILLLCCSFRGLSFSSPTSTNSISAILMDAVWCQNELRYNLNQI